MKHRYYAATLCQLISLIACCLCVSGHPQEKSVSRPSSSKQGTGLFSANCSSCHGLDGRGGERAPNIAGKRELQKLSNAELEKIVRDGVPGTGMPSFRSLGNAKIQAIVKHLRRLQGEDSMEPLPGSSAGGKSLFFGKAGCSGCHMVNGAGGFMGSDLSAYARSKPSSEIRDVIIKPAKRLNGNETAVTVTTQDGQTLTGIARNEDNFSLQLQTQDGSFHFFDKSNVRQIEYRSEPLMPSDYGTRLSKPELNDIISYLMDLSRSTQSVAEPKRAKSEQFQDY